MTQNMRTIDEVKAIENRVEVETLTAFRRYTAEDGTVWADLKFDGSGIGAPLGEVPDDWTPKVGAEVLMWGDGIGRPVRGIAIDGVLLYYRTREEQDAKHREDVDQGKRRRIEEFESTGRVKLDADYAALPPIFQARIDRFRRNNPDFRWEYEDYEMFCCTEAVKLARHFGTIEAAEHYASLTKCSITEEKERWYREWEEQKAIDKAAGLADGHSGNTHGTAVALAFWFLKHPENVEAMHGALAPLVGSEEYGCVPRPTSAVEVPA